MKKTLYWVLVLCAFTLSASAQAPLAPIQWQRVDSLSDDFASEASLARWPDFSATEGWPSFVKAAQVKDGMLTLTPHTSGWYAEYHGAFLQRQVAGAFRFTARIKVTGQDSIAPTQVWSLAGLMVREMPAGGASAWQPRAENWLFLTTGIAEPLKQVVFETKTTVNSRSALKLWPAQTGWMELCITRVGPVFVLLYRYEGQTEWTLLERFYRPDLPRRVQVGFNAYTDWYATTQLQQNPRQFNSTVVTTGRPDLQLHIDWVTLEQPAAGLALSLPDLLPMVDYSTPAATVQKWIGR